MAGVPNAGFCSRTLWMFGVAASSISCASTTCSGDVEVSAGDEIREPVTTMSPPPVSPTSLV
jgi:hypothetical protein